MEVDHDIYYGIGKEKVDVVTVDPETGKEKKSKKEISVVTDAKISSPYAVLFDERNVNYVMKDPTYNFDFLKATQNALTQKLQRQGWLFLNDARIAFGYKPIPEGQVLGWIYDPENPDRDCFVSIGIDNDMDVAATDFIRGFAQTFLIDFNVDGPIIDEFANYDLGNRVAA